MDEARQSLITKALPLPVSAISYFVTEQLHRLFPGRAVVEGSGGDSDWEAYVRAGQAEDSPADGVMSEVIAQWDGPGKGLVRYIETGLRKVVWQGHSVDLLLLSWHHGGFQDCKTRHFWIVAESVELGEALYNDIIEWNSVLRSEVLVFEGGSWQKSAQLFQNIKNAQFDNLVLARDLVENIKTDFAHFLASREVYQRYGIPWKRGVLFIGPPGNGKTHTVKALINWLQQPCLYVKSFKAQYSTDHESIRSVFHRAREITPCILVLEDLDSLIDDRNRSFFLNELDGFSMNTGVLVVATTNHPERLDPSILDRPSRFDRKYHFDLPAVAERLAYVALWNRTLEPDLRSSEPELTRVAEVTEEFSYAYLKELFLSSMMRWIEDPRPGTMAGLLLSQAEALRGQMSTPIESPAIVLDSYDEEE